MFRHSSDAQMFVMEIGRTDLFDQVSEEFEPSEEMLEIFLHKRRKVMGQMKDFSRSQASKANWKMHRPVIMTGIKQFHKSTNGKRFHRALGQFNATHLFAREGHNEGLSLYELGQAAKGISSCISNIYIGCEFYKPLSEEIDYWEFTEGVVPVLASVLARIREEKIGEITGEEGDLLIRMTDSASIITAISYRAKEIGRAHV